MLLFSFGFGPLFGVCQVQFAGKAKFIEAFAPGSADCFDRTPQRHFWKLILAVSTFDCFIDLKLNLLISLLLATPFQSWPLDRSTTQRFEKETAFPVGCLIDRLLSRRVVGRRWLQVKSANCLSASFSALFNSIQSSQVLFCLVLFGAFPGAAGSSR